MLPLGVCVFAEPAPNRPRTTAYPGYIHEILAHAGVPYERLNLHDIPLKLPHIPLLLTVGDTTFDDATKATLQSWLADGGCWINLCGTCGMDATLGLQPAPSYQGFGAGARTLGEGYLVAKSKHPITTGVEKPLHFFNGYALTPTTATVLATALDCHGREKNEPILFEQKVGKGRAITLAVDLTGTVVHVQQGRCVTRDGVPAPDGTAPVSDGVLKSGDGGVLDWIFDRDEAPGTGTQAFLRPVADLWRELLLRAIFHCANEAKVSLPVLWYWPRNLPAVAHMSHDTDGNDPERGWHLLKLLKEAEINTTWCTIMPGYGPDIMASIKQAGHELATHYDAMTDGLTEFSEANFDIQWKGLLELFGSDAPPTVTNKNHYLRWEGDMEFFDWCAKRGIQLDQSKGASKTGEAGYNFGTCHTYFPVRFNGDVVNVLEMATPTQDLHVFAKEELFDSLLAVSLRHHGLLHLLYHPHHTIREDVGGSLVRCARRAKEAGLEWWTGRQINYWERARRRVQWDGYAGSSVAVRSATPLPQATILWLNGTGGQSVTRWGFSFAAKTVDMINDKPLTV